ncbi:hypothetical protein [Nostoc sp. 2RC]|uniref:hypothetical protein n=1 Tax=Nostoc sp. 2RC TaxID=2485484 RepID=UPI00162A6AA6|nr:hypothetical protein [Nostoc sp. 2RC]MBC1236515.1 hypothetical protein [Nostoc sp. 2RC]
MGETPKTALAHLFPRPNAELKIVNRAVLPQIPSQYLDPLAHDISPIPLLRPQVKLTINQPGDIYEQQAFNYLSE